jgi:hypothetical protein
MSALSKASLVAAAVTSLAIIGGGIAFAGSWFTTSPTLTVKKLTTVTMPAFGSGPAVQRTDDKVTIQWVTRKLVKGVTVQRYLVRRYNTATGTSTQVCGAAVTVSRCRDTDVPAGEWEYTVRTAQYLWSGPESPRSAPITIPSGSPQAKAAAAPSPAPATQPSTTASPTATPTTKPTPPQQTTEATEPPLPTTPESKAPESKAPESASPTANTPAADNPPPG